MTQPLLPMYNGIGHPSASKLRCAESQNLSPYFPILLAQCIFECFLCLWLISCKLLTKCFIHLLIDKHLSGLNNCRPKDPCLTPCVQSAFPSSSLTDYASSSYSLGACHMIYRILVCGNLAYGVCCELLWCNFECEWLSF
jgi:hypothetical protein